MMPLRAVRGAGWTVLVGLATAFGSVSAASQDFVTFVQATIGMQTGQHNAAALHPDHNFRDNVTATTNAPVKGASLLGSDRRGNPLWAIPLTSLTATQERPIFSPSRRPQHVAEPPTPQSPPLQVSEQPRRPLLALVGAIAGDDEGIAIFLDETTKGVLRLRTGESHLGWTLQLVKGREVTLKNDRETAILTLPNPSAK